jgi:hypothetical protein
MAGIEPPFSLRRQDASQYTLSPFLAALAAALVSVLAYVMVQITSEVTVRSEERGLRAQRQR